MEVYHVTLFYVPIFFLTPLCVAVHVYILAINRFLVTVSKPVFWLQGASSSLVVKLADTEKERQVNGKEILVYGWNLHLQIVHQTIRPSWMNLLMNCLPNKLTLVDKPCLGRNIHHGKESNTPTGSKNKGLEAAPQPHLSLPNLHGLMVSMDARHTRELRFDSLLRHFFKNLNQH